MLSQRQPPVPTCWCAHEVVACLRNPAPGRCLTSSKATIPPALRGPSMPGRRCRSPTLPQPHRLRPCLRAARAADQQLRCSRRQSWGGAAGLPRQRRRRESADRCWRARGPSAAAAVPADGFAVRCVRSLDPEAPTSGGAVTTYAYQSWAADLPCAVPARSFLGQARTEQRQQATKASAALPLLEPAKNATRQSSAVFRALHPQGADSSPPLMEARSAADRFAAFRTAFWKFLRPHTIRGTILGATAVTARALLENQQVHRCLSMGINNIVTCASTCPSFCKRANEQSDALAPFRFHFCHTTP